MGNYLGPYSRVWGYGLGFRGLFSGLGFGIGLGWVGGLGLTVQLQVFRGIVGVG